MKRFAVALCVVAAFLASCLIWAEEPGCSSVCLDSGGELACWDVYGPFNPSLQYMSNCEVILQCYHYLSNGQIYQACYERCDGTFCFLV